MELSFDQEKSFKSSFHVESIDSFDRHFENRPVMIDQNNYNSNLSRVSKGLLQEPSRRPSVILPQTSKGVHAEGRLEVPQDTANSRYISQISITLADDSERVIENPEKLYAIKEEFVEQIENGEIFDENYKKTFEVDRSTNFPTSLKTFSAVQQKKDKYL